MLSKERELELKKFANKIRREAMTAIAASGMGHVGGSMSVAEVFASLYNGIMNVRPTQPDWPERDKIVMSKGHAGPIMYATLAEKGYFPVRWLKTLNAGGTDLPSHTDRLHTPGVDMSTGSLGQGSSTATGLAMSDRMQGRSSKTFLIMGDGELNEGQVWEAMMFAADKKLTNLVSIVDYNKMQVDGLCKDVCDMGDLVEKFTAFGIDARFVEDGNDVKAVYEAIESAAVTGDRPTCVIMNTMKGKDALGFEDNYLCHHTHVSPEQLAACLKHFDEIDAALDKEVAL